MRITKARLRQIIMEELQTEAGSSTADKQREKRKRAAALRASEASSEKVQSKKAKTGFSEAMEEEDCPEGEDCPEKEAVPAGNPGDLEELKRLIARELKNLL